MDVGGAAVAMLAVAVLAVVVGVKVGLGLLPAPEVMGLVAVAVVMAVAAVVVVGVRLRLMLPLPLPPGAPAGIVVCLGVRGGKGIGGTVLIARSLAYFRVVDFGVPLEACLFVSGVWVWDGVKGDDLATRPVRVVWRTRRGVEGGSLLNSSAGKRKENSSVDLVGPVKQTIRELLHLRLREGILAALLKTWQREINVAALPRRGAWLAAYLPSVLRGGRLELRYLILAGCCLLGC
jgi:hypothetical protein